MKLTRLGALCILADNRYCRLGKMLGFGAVVGSTAFFITHGFKRYAESQEERLLHDPTSMSDIAKGMER